MLLQNDTPTLTLNRERASRILYDNEPLVPTSISGNVAVNFAETSKLFKTNHNLSEYNKLVNSEYANKITESMQVDLSQTQQPAQGAAEATPKVVPKTLSPKFERYYNEANPVPQNLYQSFRPKTLTDFSEIGFQPESSADENLTKLFEAPVGEATENAEQTEIASSTTTQSYLRLNAKGLIACVSFIAVTALIAILVILNSIAIGSSGARIDDLKAENSALAAEYNTAMTEREMAYKNGIQDANGGTSTGQVVNVPSVKSYNLAPKNSDYSTSLFDQICKFLTSIFG